MELLLALALVFLAAGQDQNARVFGSKDQGVTLPQVVKQVKANYTREAMQQMIEGAGAAPLNFAGMNLSQYRLIVFGSNNADYDQIQVTAIKNYVFAGGSALFISDANFGSVWGDAPGSDQDFLNSFGLVMNQDHGTYTLARSAGDFGK